MRTCVRALARLSPGFLVTSQGHSYARFQRLLATRASPDLIRAAAAELSHIGLEDSLAICLIFLDSEPATFPRAAVRWASRLAVEHGLGLIDAQLALAALAALQDDTPRAGAEALVELCQRYGLRRGERTIQAWLERRGLSG